MGFTSDFVRLVTTYEFVWPSKCYKNRQCFQVSKPDTFSGLIFPAAWLYCEQRDRFSVGRELHWYRRGQGFKSRSDLFQALISQLLHLSAHTVMIILVLIFSSLFHHPPHHQQSPNWLISHQIRQKKLSTIDENFILITCLCQNLLLLEEKKR